MFVRKSSVRFDDHSSSEPLMKMSKNELSVKNRLYDLSALCIADRDQFVASTCTPAGLQELMGLSMTGDTNDRYTAICLLDVISEAHHGEELDEEFFTMRIVFLLSSARYGLRSQMVLRLLGMLRRLVGEEGHYETITEKQLFECINAARLFNDVGIRRACVELADSYYEFRRVEYSARVSLFMSDIFSATAAGERRCDVDVLQLMVKLMYKSSQFRDSVSTSSGFCKNVILAAMQHTDSAAAWHVLANLRGQCAVDYCQQYVVRPALALLAGSECRRFETLLVKTLCNVFESANYRMRISEMRYLLLLPEIPWSKLQIACLCLMESQRHAVARPLYTRYFGELAYCKLPRGVEWLALTIERVAERYREKPSRGFVDRSFLCISALVSAILEANCACA